MWQEWVNVVLGLWIIAIPFTGMANDTLMWSLVVTGVAVAALGLWGAQEVASEREAGRMVTQH